MKLADALVEALRDWGVSYVFGVSGANIEHVHDAIHRLGGGELSSVMAKSEAGAAFMADSHARVHQRLSVCCATSGGGMLNLAAGIAESYAESVPVLALVGQISTSLEGRGGFQDSSGIGRSVDGVRFWRSIAKYVAKIRRADDFWPTLRAAVTAALSHRRGPAVLLLPRDVYDLEVGPRPHDWPNDLASIGRPGVVSSLAITPVYEAIAAAKRPVLVIGQGVRRCSDAAAVRCFARTVGLPVVTTMSARAEFPDDDPLYLGMVGAAGHPSANEYLRDQADLVVLAGAGLDMMTRSPIERGLPSKRLVVVDVDVEGVSRIARPDLAVSGDAGAVFRALLALAERRPFKVPPVRGYSLRCYAPVLAPELPGSGAPAGGDVLLQSEALSIINEHLPEGGHILFDAGNCAAAAMHYIRMPDGTSSTIALGMGGMGYAIAGAIGAQLGSPRGTKTTVFCGDGAFLMVGLELHTAVHLRLPILFLVFNNGMHGMCATRQQIYFDARIECVRYPSVDFATLARGLGSPDDLWVGSASSRAELEACLRDYHENHGDVPGVLDIRLPREELPPFTPFLGAEAPTIAVERKVKRASRRQDNRVIRSSSSSLGASRSISRSAEAARAASRTPDVPPHAERGALA